MESHKNYSSGAAPFGLFTTCFHRNGYVTRAKPAGVFRVIVLGDSVAYGWGLARRDSLPSQLENRLNAARPDRWIECVTMAVPGACFFHNLGRIINVLPELDPDLVLIPLSNDDAYLIRRQPYPPYDVLINTWVEYKPLLRAALEEFLREFGPERKHRVIFSYHQQIPAEAGGAFPPRDVPRELCAELGLAFLDANPAYDALDHGSGSLSVSTGDEHPGPRAVGIAADQIARYVLDNGIIPAPAPAVTETGRIDALLAVHRQLPALGVPPYIAALRTRRLLENKRADSGDSLDSLGTRSGIKRQIPVMSPESKESPESRAIEALVAEAQHRALTPAAAAAGRFVRDGDLLHDYMFRQFERPLHEYNAVTWVLACRARAGVSGPDPGTIPSLFEFDAGELARLDNEALLETLAESHTRRIENVSAQLEQLDAAARLLRAPASENDEAAFLLSAVNTVTHQGRVLRASMTRLLDLAARSPRNIIGDETRLLLFYFLKRGDFLTASFDVLANGVFARQLLRLAQGTGPKSEWMLLDLTFHQTGAPVPHAVHLSADGFSPAFAAFRLHGLNLIPDTAPHTYSADIPLFFAGQFTLEIYSSNVKNVWESRREPALARATLSAPGYCDIDISNRIAFVRAAQDMLFFRLGPVCIFEGRETGTGEA